MSTPLPNLSSSTLFLFLQSKYNKPLIIRQQTSLSASAASPSPFPTRPPNVSLSALLPTVQSTSVRVAQLDQSPGTTQGGSDHQHRQQQRNDFYVNLGLAVRTLREDLPLIFSKDLNCNIYRDDITFADPLNTFTGIENYKLIFWALRFHGQILFREIGVEVLRIWQPCENVILIRWNLRGIPKVPWEAEGEFQGTSRYKFDRIGKIYQHKVDNLAFNFPQQLKPAVSVLDLVAAATPVSPNPTFTWWPALDAGEVIYPPFSSPSSSSSSSSSYSSSWVELYRVVRETLDRRENHLIICDDLIIA